MIKIDPKALQAIGFDPVAVNAILHFLRMVGEVENAQTLPQTVMHVAMQATDSATPTIAELRKDFESSLINIPGDAGLAELQKEVAALRQQVETITSNDAALAELRKWAEGVAVSAMFPSQATDWEHPGMLGDKTPSSAAVTRIQIDRAAVGTALLPVAYLATDTTSGLYRPAVNQWGLSIAAVNVVTWSATGALYKQNVSTEKQLISTVVTGTAPLQVASTTLVPNLHVERATKADNLGTATVYPANATDLPTVITLANALKAANTAKGV